MKMRYVLICALVAVLVSGIASADIGISGTTITFNDATTQDTAAVVYTRIIVVPADGTPVENGTALLAAMAAIFTEAADNRFLLQLEPGGYDLGASFLTLRSYIDLAGSGVLSTFVTSSAIATVLLADFSAVRNIEIVNSGSTSAALVGVGVSSEVIVWRVRLEHT